MKSKANFIVLFDECQESLVRISKALLEYMLKIAGWLVGMNDKK